MSTNFRASILTLSAIASIGVATLAASTPAEARLFPRGTAFTTRFSGTTLQRHPGAAKFVTRLQSNSVLQRHPGAAKFVARLQSNSVLQRHPGAAAFVARLQAGSALQRHPLGMNYGCRFGRCFGYRPYGYGMLAATTYAAAPAYAAPAPTYVAAPAPAYAPAPAVATTCLKKEYTQDGQVVFSDVCTNESVAGRIGSQVQAPQQQ